MLNRKILPRNTHGTVGIYEDTYQDHSAKHYCKLQLKWPSISIWMDFRGNYTRNVWTPTSGNYCKKITRKALKQTWILPSQTYTRIVETCVDTHLIQIVSRQYWNWLCRKWSCRSSDESIEDVLRINHNILGRMIILRYNHEIRLYKYIYVDISMLVYVKWTLHQFNNKTPKYPQHRPYKSPEGTYGVDAQKMKLIDTSPVLSTEWVKRIERIVRFFILREGGIQQVTSTIKYNRNTKWPHRTKWEECTPILWLHGKIFKWSCQISRFRHNFTCQHRCVIYDWTTSMQSCCRTVFIREYTFKMCAGAPKWPSTCKLQHFKICCCLWTKSINWGVLCDRKICHHFTKHVRRNGPPTVHYTSMKGKYNSR